MIIYVQRDQGGNIIGVFANRQPGVATEPVDDSDPSVVAFVTSSQPDNAPTLVALRQAATQAITDIDAYLAAADNGTATQIAARDHIALKGLVQDVKLIIKYLIATS